MNAVELYQFFDLEIRYVCNRVGVLEYGIPEPWELLQGISGANTEIHGLLMAFLTAYQNWNNYSEELFAQGRGGRLGDVEHQQLQALTNQRDETRRRLREKVNLLPQR